MGVPWCQSSCVSKLLAWARGRDAIFFLAAVAAAWAPWWAVTVLEAAMLPSASRRTLRLEQLLCPNTSQMEQGLLCLSGLVFSTLCFLVVSVVVAPVCMKNVCACEWEVLQGKAAPEEPWRKVGLEGPWMQQSLLSEELTTGGVWLLSSFPAQGLSTQKEQPRVNKCPDLQPPQCPWMLFGESQCDIHGAPCYLGHFDAQHSSRVSLQSNPCSLLYQVFV